MLRRIAAPPLRMPTLSPEGQSSVGIKSFARLVEVYEKGMLRVASLITRLISYIRLTLQKYTADHRQRGDAKSPRRPSTFYEEQYKGEGYKTFDADFPHSEYERLNAFIKTARLESSRVLDVGCGRGAFQDLVTDYTGVDIAVSAGRWIHKKFLVASATSLPLPDNHYDCVWSAWTLEHVPEPEKGLEEMRRVTKSRGYIFLCPAWQCRPWAANGYDVRPYEGLDLWGKMIKVTIPLRNSVLFRSLYLVPKRLAHHVAWVVMRRPTRFWYRKLRPNYEKFWTSDSDACNWMDPHEAILWFVSRGDDCLNHPVHFQGLLVRTGALIFQVKKRN